MNEETHLQHCSFQEKGQTHEHNADNFEMINNLELTMYIVIILTTMHLHYSTKYNQVHSTGKQGFGGGRKAGENYGGKQLIILMYFVGFTDWRHLKVMGSALSNTVVKIW